MNISVPVGVSSHLLKSHSKSMASQIKFFKIIIGHPFEFSPQTFIALCVNIIFEVAIIFFLTQFVFILLKSSQGIFDIVHLPFLFIHLGLAIQITDILGQSIHLCTLVEELNLTFFRLIKVNK